MTGTCTLSTSESAYSGLIRFSPSSAGCGGYAAILHHAFVTILLTLSILLSITGYCGASVDVRKAGEYQVKAAFIINFINFIDWPENTRAPNTVTLGILGRDPFDGALDALKGKTVKGRQLIVRHYDDPEEARDADIIYICPSEKRTLQRILKTLRNRPVLTIGDYQGFARSGVMINMVLVNKRVGFEVNLAASQRAGIRISSQLLKLAKEVVEQ